MFNPAQRLLLLFGATLLTGISLAAQPLSDPMRPPAGNTEQSTAQKVTKPAADDFYLSAIRITKAQRSATINGRSVTVGERIGTARVVAIQSSSVTLHYSGKTHSISLLPLSIKKPVEASQP